jgi:PrtD family type I secretion system ABC transporter
MFDALWAPMYLAVIFLLHPLLGILAMVGAILLAALALVNELVTRGPLRGAASLWMRGMQDAEMAARNAEAVIGMGMTAGITAKWLAGNERMQALQIKASRNSTTIVATTKVIRLALQVGVLGLGAFLVLDHAMTAGQMIAGSIIMSRALAPVETAISTWKQIVDYRTARSRLLRFFDKPTVRRTGMALPVPSGQLSVEGVVFAPPGAEEPTLRRVTFAADPGEVVAIVGPSAAGKSTLARLLVAAWRPTSGVVRLDDADVYEWPRDDFGHYVGYLPQDVELFAGTVRENIARMANAGSEAEADDEDAASHDAEVIEAARLAGVHEMVLRLPKGYETEIGSGGARLSAGQRQRIALARAVFGRPRLVVLDEPNANLDIDGEMALAKAVVALRERGTTVVVISHRQNILMQADKILVLRNGAVEMFGARNEVLRRILPGARREPGTTPATPPAATPSTAAPKFAEQRTP